MDIMSLGTCLPIIAICFGIGIGCKKWDALPDKWIPFILFVIGGVLGVPAMSMVPNFPATDYITAVAVGAMSGLASVGVHQSYKQLKQ